MKAASLRRRIVQAIVATTILTSLLFGLTTFVFAYNLEDRLFNSELAREVQRQQAAWQNGGQQTGQLVPPLLPYVRIYRGGARLPDDLAPQIAAESQRTEFYGSEGRHYHVARFVLPGQRGGAAMAVVEGSRYLLVRPMRNSLIIFLTGLSLLVALAASLVGSWLARRALAPLDRLTGELASAGQGVPHIDSSQYPANEIGMLAGALATAFDRLRGFVAREQAFTRDASHELRTPLAVIGGAAELLATDPALPMSARPALRRIETASADMAQALDLLLALAREGEQRERVTAQVLPLVQKAIASAAIRFPGNAMQVKVSITVGAVAPVDAVLLQLVLNNLIGNSFQHAVGSELRVTGDGTRLVIVDTGPGMAAVADPFAPFGDRTQSTGSGLGLPIVRRLCDVAGIGIEQRDAVEGRGTSFQLDFLRVGPPASSTTP